MYLEAEGVATSDQASAKESAKESLLVFFIVFRIVFLHCICSLRTTTWEKNRSNTDHTVDLVLGPLFFHRFGGNSVFVIRSQSLVICDCYFASEIF